MSERQLISVVVPVYNDEEVIEAFYERTTGVLNGLDGFAYQLVFVDDGSADRSVEVLKRLAAKDSAVKVVVLSRNFGHQIAVTAGIDVADGDLVVLIDSDLQDPPELIVEFIKKWREGYDVVYGVRTKREGETWFKRASAALFYRVLARITNVGIPEDVGDYRMMTRRFVEELKRLGERDRFVRGLVSWIGFKQAGVEYERGARQAGETGYTLRKLYRFAKDGITSFSTLPLRLVMYAGFAASALAFLYLLSVFIQKWAGVAEVRGWPTMMIAILFLGGIQLISLGVIGEYIGRIFNEVKGRPIYVVKEVISDEKEDDASKS
ncbi:MAG: glycosyltransferase involved in cell wall biosynthesis [Verrucomicrobiales bacterium]|jgi:glycosyltransferase involved in cell wall biosynthesis